ncbi:MAG: hypothetical protein A3C93_01605 [Candidatus Lloydbacteria bacterium RIFCSPHIGHO2_02_FULL_54_17]|uniref:N-acetylmuramoyl-L-alanine amidase n=1 Tax=Candidatus Lloydbacteria bacterium RIFCSPHIGHO2_02_FULL_54_17 TaxID=1798664 RepID=A0A1G2DDX3_9BACT|nr:MAG: hypothetical protein A3C93_01605 [Candidatus Lloydbacteria bacterium RIFCSPHIGHO2_02_FULL_54_17]OGZ15465.1 MAG: hypothetical protein A2948_02725 [Candidatus Lloydbacteria bacterium RIFCSPLOWO2_01_FULL_54_18]
MAKYFDEAELANTLTRADWYLDLFLKYGELAKNHEAVEEFYAFIEQRLAAGAVLLGKSGPDWDRERRPVDTVVVHHTHCPPGITRERLSAMHLVRLYAANYASPAPSDYHKQGDAIFSGHFWKEKPRETGEAAVSRGKQVFYAYHWIIRMDGTAERLLADDELGWHAGDWGVNCRSVGIVLDNNFEEETPPDAVVGGLARLIRERYAHVSRERIMGHREVSPKTTCPGKGFLGGWKDTLFRTRPPVTS